MIMGGCGCSENRREIGPLRQTAPLLSSQEEKKEHSSEEKELQPPKEVPQRMVKFM
jgi:hypothetical protein